MGFEGICFLSALAPQRARKSHIQRDSGLSFWSPSFHLLLWGSVSQLWDAIGFLVRMHVYWLDICCVFSSTMMWCDEGGCWWRRPQVNGSPPRSLPMTAGWRRRDILPPPSVVQYTNHLDVTQSLSHPVQQSIVSIVKQRNLTMKENYTELYPNEQVATAVGDYAYEHSTKLPKHITDHHAWGSATQEKANYMISPFQAQFHVWIAKAVGAKRSMSGSSSLVLSFS